MTLLAVINGVLDLLGVATLFAVIAAIINPESQTGLIFSRLYENIFENSANTYLPFIVPTSILTGVFIVKNLIAIAISKAQVNISFNINRSISNELIHSHIYADAMHHRSEHSTESINRLSTVSLYLADTLIIGALTLISELFVAFLVLVFAAVIWPVMFVYLIISIFPVTVLILMYNRKKLKKYGLENNQLIPEMYHTITDSIYGFEDIRLSNTEGRFSERLQRIRDRIYNNRKKIILLSDHYHFRVLETLVVASLLVITALTVWRTSGDDLTLILALYSAIAFRLVPSISRVVGSFNSLSSYHYIVEMMVDKEHPVMTIADEKQLLPDLAQGIQMENLFFAFIDSQYVLENINIELKKGQSIGIKGPSGAGKTTLLNLIIGFYFPTSGSLKVDHHPLTENNVRSWHEQVAYVRQNAFLLSGTIAENVAFGQDHSEIDLQAVHLCLSKVGLWPWVESLKDGLRTNVGELGNAISGGQRQRLAIARALYKNGNVFVFDEPTTSLDADSASEVIDAIFDLIENKDATLIIVSHDERILTKTDVCYQLDQGHLKKV